MSNKSSNSHKQKQPVNKAKAGSLTLPAKLRMSAPISSSAIPAALAHNGAHNGAHSSASNSSPNSPPNSHRGNASLVQYASLMQHEGHETTKMPPPDGGDFLDGPYRQRGKIKPHVLRHRHAISPPSAFDGQSIIHAKVKKALEGPIIDPALIENDSAKGKVTNLDTPSLDSTGIDSNEAEATGLATHSEIPANMLSDIWTFVTYRLSGEVSRQVMARVFDQLKPVSFEGGVFHLAAKSDVALEIAQKSYEKLILRFLQISMPTYIVKSVAFTLSPALLLHQSGAGQKPATSAQKANMAKGQGAQSGQKDGQLDPLPRYFNEEDPCHNHYESLAIPLRYRYQFESFLVDDTNRRAHRLAKRLVDEVVKGQHNDGEAPTYIFYGELSCGKTHLMQAIAWELQLRRPDLKRLFFKTNAFKYNFAKAIKNRQTVGFREMINEMDVLLIDDVHQLPTGYRPSSEEFLAVLADFRARGKLVIMTSCPHPRALNEYHPALRSRLLGGAVVEIEPPGEKLTHSVIKHEAERLGVNKLLAPGCLSLLAKRLPGGLRGMSGQLLSLSHTITAEEAPWSLERFSGFLDRQLGGQRRVTLSEILGLTTKHYGVSKAEFMSRRRLRHIALCRHVTMYLAKQLTSKSFPEIARDLGKLDHTSVMYGVRKVEELMKDDAGFKADIEELTNKICCHNSDI